MKLALHGSRKSIQVADTVFAAPVRESLVHQVLTSYSTTGRSGTRAQKSRSDARGGGAKPWRQKGTGRARAGSRRSPLWRSGGVTFAARPQDWSQKINRKMYRGAMCSILSALVRDTRLHLVPGFHIEKPKTSLVLQRLDEYKLDVTRQRLLLVLEALDENSILGVRNLPRVAVTEVKAINPYDLLRFDQIVITEPALRRVEAWLS